jgi:anaerobic selenocysteine-containing dehydrogenase
VEINPQDASHHSIKPNEWIFVESQRGRLRARAFVTQSVQPGQLFIPMHYEPTNQLTDAVFDPHSSQPSYKCCAVRILKN